MRELLAELLLRQSGVGGARRDIFDPIGGHHLFPRNFIEAEDCGEAIKLEWQLMPQIESGPACRRQRSKPTSRTSRNWDRHAHRMIALWGH